MTMKMLLSRRRSVLCMLMVAGLGVSAAAQGSDDDPAGEDHPPGWERFVAPLVEAGETGWVFFPADYAGNVLVEILDPEGYRIHLTKADDPEEDRVVPAGEPFHPSVGRWRLWLEGDWSISPSSELVEVASRRTAERLDRHWTQVVSGGRVTLPPGAATEPSLDLWLLHGGPVPGRERHEVYELSRRQRVGDVEEGVLMPAGMVLGGLWDRREKRYVALSPPFAVPPGDTVPAPLGRPAAEGSWLLAFATLPHPIPRDTLVDLAPVVTQNGQRHPPDTTITTAGGTYGAWYGLAPGPAVLGDGSSQVYLPATALELPAGGITRVDADLRQRPLLDVSLVLPALVREKPFSLVVRKLPERVELAREELRRDAGHSRFRDRLVHGVLEVVLETHVGPFRQQVELTDEEAFVSIEPEVIEIDGTVRRGGEPHPATVRFQGGSGEFVEATADESGEYRVQTLELLRRVEVHLDGVDHQPWQDLYFRPIDSSRRIDFDIPDAGVRVKVVDAATREPIPGARVSARNDYGELREPRPGAPADTGGRRQRERVLAATYEADGDGVARLPPPRPGGLEVHASAEGHRPLEEPVFLEIADPPQDVELEIGLEAYGETVAVRLLLPDGSPAAGAEVRRVDSLAERGVGFVGRADAAGIVEVPAEQASGLLLATHPAAAFGIADWQRLRAQHGTEWSLPPAASHPLSLRVWDPSGEVPAQAAPLAVWVGEHKLTGWWLHRLLDAPPQTDENGFWTARNLPQAPVRVLVWSHRLQGQAASGSLDALATEIEYPWPATVDLRAVP